MNGNEIKITRKLFSKNQKEVSSLFNYTTRQWRRFENDEATPPEDVMIRLYEMRLQVEPAFLKDIYSKISKLREENIKLQKDFKKEIQKTIKDINKKIELADKQVVSHIATTYFLPDYLKGIKPNESSKENKKRA